MLHRAPVAAIEAVAADEVQRAGDVAAAALGHDEQAAVTHRFADEREEAAVEVRPPPLAAAGFHVEIEERVPVPLLDFGAGEPLDEDAVGQRLAPLLADGLALAAVERREEAVEIAIAAVEPVILNAVADQPAALLAFRRVGVVQEGRVRRRNLVLDDDRFRRRKQLLRL